MLLYVGAVALPVGLAMAGLVVLGNRSGGGVARSLALIEQGLQPREVARQDLAASDRLVRPVLDAFRRLAIGLSPGGTATRLGRLLDAAGNPPAWPVERVFAAKGVSLVVGVLLGVFYGHLTIVGAVLAVLLGAALFHLPDLLVYNLGLRRQERLRHGLADALDMLTVCVEAGQGLDAALKQVAEAVPGPIGGEFARVLQEISIGRSRADAFSSMAARTSIPEVRTFVTAIVQADRLGLQVAGVLHEQAREMRLIRRQRAEERAQKLPVKIMFPMVLCIFPILFVIVIGPGILRLIDTFTTY